ncbi:MAG: hypothetical protein ABIG34_03430 [Candidatus Peregrinibacteria bacterium]
MHPDNIRIGEARMIRKFSQPSAYDPDRQPFRNRHPVGSPEERRQREARERGQKSDIDRFRDTTERARKLQERMQKLDRALQQKIESAGASLATRPIAEMGVVLAEETAAQETLDAYRGRAGSTVVEFRRSLNGVQGGDLRQFHKSVERRERILQETEQILREYEQKAGLPSPPIEVASIERMSPISLSRATERVKPPVERLYPYGWRDGPGQGGKQQRLILSFSTGWGREQKALPNVSGSQGAMHLGLRQSIMINNIQGARPLGQEGTERGFGANIREADEMGDIQRSLAEMGIQVRQTSNGTLVRITYIPANEYIVIEGEKIWGPIGTKPVLAQETVARRPSFAEWKRERSSAKGSSEREPQQGTLQHIAEIAGRNTEARRACERLRDDLQSAGFRWGNPDLRAADELIRSLARSEGVSDRDINRVAPRNQKQLLRFIDMVLAGGPAAPAREPLIAQAQHRPNGGMASAPSEDFALFAEPTEESVPPARTKPTPEPHTPSLFSTPSPRSTTPKKATPAPKLRSKTKPKPAPKLAPSESPSDAVPPETEKLPAAPIPPPESEKKIEKLDGKKFSELITWKTTEEETGAEKFWKQRLDEQATQELLKALDAIDYAGGRVRVEGHLKSNAAYLKFYVRDDLVHEANIGIESDGKWTSEATKKIEKAYEMEVAREAAKKRDGELMKETQMRESLNEQIKNTELALEELSQLEHEIFALNNKEIFGPEEKRDLQSCEKRLEDLNNNKDLPRGTDVNIKRLAQLRSEIGRLKEKNAEKPATEPIEQPSDALPEKTTDITHLTPEQAKQLVAKLVATGRGSLNLRGLETTIDSAVAKELVAYKGELLLRAYHNPLTEEVATILATRKGDLDLEVSTLSSKNAAILSPVDGDLDITLRGFTPDAATALMRHRPAQRKTYLFAYDNFSPETAAALAQEGGDLHISWNTGSDRKLLPEMAPAFAKWKKGILVYGGLVELTESDAKILAGVGSEVQLSIPRLSNASVEVVTALAEFRGKKLYINGHLSEELNNILKKNPKISFLDKNDDGWGFPAESEAPDSAPAPKPSATTAMPPRPPEVPIPEGLKKTPSDAEKQWESNPLLELYYLTISSGIKGDDPAVSHATYQMTERINLLKTVKGQNLNEFVKGIDGHLKNNKNLSDATKTKLQKLKVTVNELLKELAPATKPEEPKPVQGTEIFTLKSNQFRSFEEVGQALQANESIQKIAARYESTHAGEKLVQQQNLGSKFHFLSVENPQVPGTGAILGLTKKGKWVLRWSDEDREKWQEPNAFIRKIPADEKNADLILLLQQLATENKVAK